eukprot:gene150-4396_t
MDFEDVSESLFPYNLTNPQLLHIVSEIKSSKGVEVRDRTYKFHTYKKCMIASEAVDWTLKLSCFNSLKREYAIQLLQLLQELGFIEHSSEPEKEFLDGYHFYKFNPKKDEEITKKFEEQKNVINRMSVEGIEEFNMKFADSFGNGITIKDRKIGPFKKIKDCFVGDEAVEWIQLYYSFSKELSIKFGKILLDNLFIEPAHGDKTFQNNESLYRITSDFESQLQKYALKLKNAKGSLPTMTLGKTNYQPLDSEIDDNKKERSKRQQKDDDDIEEDDDEKTEEENVGLKIFHELVEVNNEIKDLELKIKKEEEEIKSKELRQENIQNEIKTFEQEISNLEKRMKESKNLAEENLKHSKQVQEETILKYESEERKREKQMKEIEEKIELAEKQLKGDYKETEDEKKNEEQNSSQQKDIELLKIQQQIRQIETMSELLKKQVKKEKEGEEKLKVELETFKKEKEELDETYSKEITEVQSKFRSFIMVSFTFKETEEALQKEISELEKECQLIEEKKQMIKVQAQNPILDAYISKLEQNDPKIKEIVLPKNKLTDEDVSKIFNAIETNTHLTKLDLSYNSQIKGDCVEDILKVFEKNTVLEDVSFEGCPLSQKSIQILLKNLEKNTSLTQLFCGINETEDNISAIEKIMDRNYENKY